MRLTVTVTVDEQQKANDFFKQNIDREGGDKTFTVPTEDGLGFKMSGEFTDEQAAKIKEYFGI